MCALWLFLQAGEGEGSTLPRFTAIWPVGAVLCDLFSIVKGGDCTSIDRRLSSIGAALKANVAATLLDRLSRLEEEAAPVRVTIVDGVPCKSMQNILCRCC